MCFDLVAVLHYDGHRIYTFMTNFSEGSLSATQNDLVLKWTLNHLANLFHPIYSGITCIIFMKEFISLIMVAMWTEKMQFLGYHSHGCYEEKKNFFKNLNFIDSNHHSENWVDWITVGWDKM